jgi:hypothetical protein
MKPMSNEDSNEINKKFGNKLFEMYKASSSGTDFQKKVELDTSNRKLDNSSDGDTPSDDEEGCYADVVQRYSNLKRQANPTDEVKRQIRDIEKKFPELVVSSDKPLTEQAVDLKKQINEENDANFAFYKTSIDKVTASVQTLQDHFGTQIQNLTDIVTNMKREQTQKFKEASQKVAQESQNEDVEKKYEYHYKEGSYTSNGETKQYTIAQVGVNWGKDLKKYANDPDMAIMQLRNYISFHINKQYGGWGRITSIVVRDQRLIINNTCFMPLIRPEDVTPEVFPIDSLQYIKNGALASFFNWKYLRKMSHLTILDIDDSTLYLTWIADDIGVGRRAGLSTIFKYIPSLETFILGGDVCNRDEEHTEAGRRIKEKLGAGRRKFNLFDGYKLDWYRASDGIQHYTVNNLVNYANNRGDKHFVRFTCGIITRGALATIGTAFNALSHLAGGIAKGVKSVFTDATTPVTEEDMY